MIEFEKLKKSLQHLELQYQNYLTMGERENLTALDKEGISESVIQRFETCYDTLWKHLKKYLEEQLGLPEVPNSPKPVFKLANENLIIKNMENWLIYANARIDTAHDYSESKLLSTLEKIDNFIQDAIALYETLTKEIWVKK